MSTAADKSSASWSPSDSTVATNPPRFGGWMVFVLLAGVLLPAATIGFELLTRMCAFFLDPFPTTWHFVLLVLVPLSNALVLWTYRQNAGRLIRPATFLLGLSSGVAFAYSIVFLPLLPFCAFGVLIFGLGLLGLAPFFAFASSLVAAKRLKALQPDKRTGRMLAWAGAVIGLIPIVLYAVVGHMTVVGLRMAASEDEATSRRGIEIIRTCGSRQSLLRACYELPIEPWAWTAMRESEVRDRVPREKARDVYYRVTGEPFNSVPPPQLAGPRTRVVEDVQFDSDIGGTAVNGIVRDVSLGFSDMHSTVDADGLSVYTEWTMEFDNKAPVDREARAEIALPPGGVVSRLTLWVKGEEREAAFAGRETVRKAYQEVAVVQSRDPVLVTTCGPDRVLMQCFPVPPQGGKMKVRLGITSPLPPDGSAYTPPHFVERNFTVSAKYDTKPIIRRGPITRTAWSPDPADPAKYAIVQTIDQFTGQSPKTIVVVVDSSLKTGAARARIADAVRKLPRGCRFCVIRAGEQVTKLVPMQQATDASIADAARRISSMRFYGGIDNTPALAQAYGLARNGGVILWIHGPQPFSASPQAELVPGLYRHHLVSPPMYAVVAADGRNSILASLEQTGEVTKISNLKELERLLAGWTGARERSSVVRERVPLRSASGTKVSQSTARLWALDEVMRLCRERRLKEAAAIASKYHLVTPVTGAVVLENDQQYVDNGLAPPAVVLTPEPATWLVLAAGVALVGLGYRRRARTSVARHRCSS